MKVEATETHQGQISGGYCLTTIQTVSVAVQYICVSVSFIWQLEQKCIVKVKPLNLNTFDMKHTGNNKKIIRDKNWNLYIDHSIVLSIIVIYKSKQARTNARSLNWNDSQAEGTDLKRMAAAAWKSFPGKHWNGFYWMISGLLSHPLFSKEGWLTRHNVDWKGLLTWHLTGRSHLGRQSLHPPTFHLTVSLSVQLSPSLPALCSHLACPRQVKVQIMSAMSSRQQESVC